MAKTPTTHLSRARCQVRPEHAKTELDVIVDGRLAGTSQWGWMCEDCHRRYGVGLGTGLGQKWQRQGIGCTFVKVEG